MRHIVIASSSRNMSAKLERLILTLPTEAPYHCKNAAELYALCDRLGGGLVIVSALKEVSISEIKNVLSFDWDILAVLPSGAPVPFYSSNLTVLNMPVSTREFLSTAETLLNVTKYRQTEYDEGADDLIGKAKRILIKKENISEDEAHYRMQKMSMDTAVPMRKLAERIIKANEI